MRVSIYFDESEYEALRKVAERERRDLRDQVAILALRALRDEESPPDERKEHPERDK